MRQTRDKEISMEWFRLITPLSIAALGTIFWFQFSHISNSVATMSADMAMVKADVQNIDQRLSRDENMLDNKKNGR